MLLLSPSVAALDKPSYLGPPPKPSPKRVVTLAPSLTQTVLALGAGDLLVGVSRFDQLPAVSRLPRVGGFIDPSVEAVISLQPDLVLVQPAPGNRRPVEKIAELGTPVLALPMRGIEETLAAIREIGKALGRTAEAERVVQEIALARERVRARAKGKKAPRVLLVYGFEPLVVAGPGSFAAELLADAGAVNAAEGVSSPYPIFSAERAVRAWADVVIDAADTSVGMEKFRNLPGLREARWVRVPSQDLMHPGPHLVRGLEELFLLLHPAVDGGK